MVDTVTKNVLCDTTMRYEVQLTSIGDGTGETNVRKIVLADLVGNPESLCLESVESNIEGFDYVKLAWDRSPDQTMLVIPRGGPVNICYKPSYLKDPLHGQALTTGDILLTTGPISEETILLYDIAGGAAGDINITASYIIKLRFKKKPN